MLLGASLLTVQSCKRQLDINQNPNVSQTTTPALLLPSAQLALGSAMGVDMQINGSIWAQYWTQYYNASQYRKLEQYQPDAAQYDRVWGLFYHNSLMDLKQLEKQAIAQNLKQYQAISLLMQAYTFQVITDAWGDVPFSQALKGLPEDGGIISPEYDKQESIYNGLITMIDNATALIDGTDPNHPAEDDLIYHGDMEMWWKFANTLKLKVLLRQSEVAPAKAQQGIAALYATAPEFLDNGEDAQISYLSTAGNQNPLYGEIVGLGNVQNLIASATSTDTMAANDDERRFAFYSGTATGVRQGFYNAPSGTAFSAPSPLVGANATDEESALAPVKLISGYESLFLQAEAIARGWATGDDQQLFEDGIAASFEAYGLDNSDYDPYIAGSYWGMYPSGGTTAEKIRHIITQKWFSMNGNQGFEAWTEWRRTGYPDFLVISANSRIGNVFPQRFFYPSSELNTNAKFPGQKLLTNKVWWDVN